MQYCHYNNKKYFLFLFSQNLFLACYLHRVKSHRNYSPAAVDFPRFNRYSRNFIRIYLSKSLHTSQSPITQTSNSADKKSFLLFIIVAVSGHSELAIDRKVKTNPIHICIICFPFRGQPKS